MESLFIDIHTHKAVPEAGVLAIRSFRIGVDALPESGMGTSEGVGISAGIHPWDCERAPEDWAQQLTHLSPWAIGEIGLDYAVPVEHGLQQAWLHRQLCWAASHRLAVILHCVRAYEALLPEVKGLSVPWVVHGFIGSWELATRLLQRGAWLSFGFRTWRSPRTVEVLRRCPADRLLLESDDSVEPIAGLYRQVAALRACSVEALQTQLLRNTETLLPASRPLLR